MKISIVTISFNQSKFLKDAIESVLNQAFPDLEYIVVDPGSTDGSREIIGQYADRITQLLFQPDRGPAEGLNNGFAQATGAVYGFVNSDDMLLPGALQQVSDCFEQTPGADIIMGDGFITNQEATPIRHIKATSFTPMRFVYGGTTSLQQSTFFRSSAYAKSSGFNESNKSCWDAELFLDLVLGGARIKYLRSDLALFRMHADSITGTDRINKVYRSDQNRLFQRVRHRSRNPFDELITIYYKALRFAADPMQLVATLRSRLARVSVVQA